MTEVQTALTLWYRRNRRQSWQVVATAAKESELTAKLLKLPSGEVVVLPNGVHPDERRLALRR